MCVVPSISGVLCCQASMFWVEGCMVHGATNSDPCVDDAD